MTQKMKLYWLYHQLQKLLKARDVAKGKFHFDIQAKLNYNIAVSYIYTKVIQKIEQKIQQMTSKMT